MAYNRRKRKVKKNIPEAQAHIHSTYNNTVVSITDKDGNVISWASAGTIGYKGSKKKEPCVLIVITGIFNNLTHFPKDSGRTVAVPSKQ